MYTYIHGLVVKFKNTAELSRALRERGKKNNRSKKK
jgi:hypothetical protein